MTDLRTGLVEAVAMEILYQEYGESTVLSDPEWVRDAINPDGFAFKWAEAYVDRMLGFLTDNAEAWERQVENFSAGVQVYGVTARNLVAALSDSRDTGEKP